MNTTWRFRLVRCFDALGAWVGGVAGYTEKLVVVVVVRWYGIGGTGSQDRLAISVCGRCP